MTVAVISEIGTGSRIIGAEALLTVSDSAVVRRCINIGRVVIVRAAIVIARCSECAAKERAGRKASNRGTAPSTTVPVAPPVAPMAVVLSEGRRRDGERCGNGRYREN
jgi:hypothetical protein